MGLDGSASGIVSFITTSPAAGPPGNFQLRRPVSRNWGSCQLVEAGQSFFLPVSCRRGRAAPFSRMDSRCSARSPGRSPSTMAAGSAKRERGTPLDAVGQQQICAASVGPYRRSISGRRWTTVFPV